MHTHPRTTAESKLNFITQKTEAARTGEGRGPDCCPRSRTAQTKVRQVLRWFTCQTLSSSYSPRAASNCVRVKPFDRQRCSASARRMEPPPPPAGTSSRMAAKIRSDGRWALRGRRRSEAEAASRHALGHNRSLPTPAGPSEARSCVPSLSTACCHSPLACPSSACLGPSKSWCSPPAQHEGRSHYGGQLIPHLHVAPQPPQSQALPGSPSPSSLWPAQPSLSLWQESPNSTTPPPCGLQPGPTLASHFL